MAAAVVLLSVLGGSAAYAASSVNVPVTASSQVAVTNVTLTTTSTSARVQFDYALVNGAKTAVVDAAFNEQQSFGQVTVTGSGHYDVTLAGITVTSSSQFYVVSSGNPDFLITAPVTTPTNPCTSFLQFLKNLVTQYLGWFF